MKKAAFLFSILFVMNIASHKIYPQQLVSIRIEIIEPLPGIDFAAFAFSNNLQGAPRIFGIYIEPAGKRVIIEGSIKWKKNGGNSFEELFHFKTRPFLSRIIFNDEIGTTDIKIAKSTSNKRLNDDNVKKGKPTGEYELALRLLDENGNELDNASRIITFSNPAQTLSIISPQEGSYENIGGVIAQWDPVIGARSYKIKANVRSNPSQSLEEAMSKGNLIIDNVDVGNATNINLRQILSREWLPNQEIVLQVTAVIPGPGGGDLIYSSIINFFLKDNRSSISLQKEETLQLIKLLSGSMSEQIMSGFLSGDIKLEDLEITDESGKVISQGEVQSILNYLNSNPDAVLNINFKPM